jgi:hypothetical protein
MASAEPPTLEELLESLRTRGMPAGGVFALEFTLPGSGEGAPRIVAKTCGSYKDEPPPAVPPEVMEAIGTHLLGCSACVYLEKATEADFSELSSATVFPANFPATIFYIYPLGESKGPDYRYVSPAGLSARDIARCVAATYHVIYAAECAAVGEEAHKKRAGGNCMNRGTTDGPFGIWGHDLRDLVLEGFLWAPLVKYPNAGSLAGTQPTSNVLVSRRGLGVLETR